MALYSYTGMTPLGQYLQGSLQAENPKDLQDKLKEQKLFLVSWHVYGKAPVVPCSAGLEGVSMEIVTRGPRERLWSETERFFRTPKGLRILVALLLLGVLGDCFYFRFYAKTNPFLSSGGAESLPAKIQKIRAGTSRAEVESLFGVPLAFSSTLQATYRLTPTLGLQVDYSGVKGGAGLIQVARTPKIVVLKPGIRPRDP